MDKNKESYNNPASIDVYESEHNRWTEGYVYDKYFRPPGRIIDLGCGTGRTSVVLSSRGLDVEAVDYSRPMIEYAQKKYGGKINFKLMDVRSLEYPDSSFDYVFFSFNGIDYVFPLSERVSVLREIYRVLKPGGIFAYSSHNAAFIPNSLSRWYGVLRSFLAGRIYPYRLEFHPFGPLLTFCGSPRKQIREAENAGFTFIELVSKYGKNEKIIRFRDPYPTYVFKK